MNKPPIKSEPPLNLSIAERETLIDSLDKAAMDVRVARETRAERARQVQLLRAIQSRRIQQLCAALGAFCDTPAVHRADGPANEYQVAIESAWDVINSSTAKKLGWVGEPTSRAMNLKAYPVPHEFDRVEMYRKAGLIKALEDHRPSPVGDGMMQPGTDRRRTCAVVRKRSAN